MVLCDNIKKRRLTLGLLTTLCHFRNKHEPRNHKLGLSPASQAIARNTDVLYVKTIGRSKKSNTPSVAEKVTTYLKKT